MQAYFEIVTMLCNEPSEETEPLDWILKTFLSNDVKSVISLIVKLETPICDIT